MQVRHTKVGLLINPIAGMGGPLALKGSDGNRAERARRLGGEPQSSRRAERALAELAPHSQLAWFCAGGDMGALLLEGLGLDPTVVHVASGPTSAFDTQHAARALVASGVDLLLFAGGDGTARDILNAVGNDVVVLGIPAGVKMHSAVFAVTPRTAGQAALAYLQGLAAQAGEAAAKSDVVVTAEVMDRELNEQGEPASSPTLYGYLRVPRAPRLLQAAKASPTTNGDAALAASFPGLAAELRAFDLVILGPGMTLYRFKEHLGIRGTLLGVDIVTKEAVPRCDLNEAELFEAIGSQRCALVLGVIGGQGFLLGRGNQQLSPRVLRRIARDDFRILASADKLAALPRSALRVDTGDEALDEALAGYVPVITGPRRKTFCEIVFTP